VQLKLARRKKVQDQKAKEFKASLKTKQMKKPKDIAIPSKDPVIILLI